MMEWVLSVSVLIILVIIIRKLLKGKISCWVRSVAVGGGSSAGSCIADGKRIQHCQFIAGKPGGRANGRKQYHGFPQDGSGAGQNIPAGGNAG